jgi:hypothetical protein
MSFRTISKGIETLLTYIVYHPGRDVLSITILLQAVKECRSFSPLISIIPDPGESIKHENDAPDRDRMVSAITSKEI